MIEICIHGRGGQGTVMAGGILATALVPDGKYVIAIPGVVQKQAVLSNKGKGNPSSPLGRFSVFCEESGKGKLPVPG